jgi:hypothetical protein
MANIQMTIKALGVAYTGRSWDDVADEVGDKILTAGHVYRWLEPGTDVHLGEFRHDRISVLVDKDHIITGYSVG